ncbi:heparinase II/III family protein [Clostridium boliviensis]|uniref:Heparinase II/III family protein n=1 Tax=Clostridium boliviensis TaxID=318465 RepID=A0ABU4GL60_9CLOT|nr:heparinase II/III family protein [Clostridium boliviensis]MDW2798362.1 heparinase II/III family protein [Clostridium boliviensis]
MITEIFQQLNKPLSGFTPFFPASHREGWESLPEELRLRLIKNGEEYLHFEYPSLTATDFMEFSRTGNRSHFQDKMFLRRTALNSLVLAECAEYQGRFLDDIINGLYLICEENAWQLPAHNSYVRDTPQEILPDVTRPVIDLFAAETGAVLSMAEYLLRRELLSVSPFLSGMINKNLEERIFTPYLKEHFWWMGDGKSHMNNWTVWCTQNVLLSAFTRELDEPRKWKILEKACRSMDYFLDEYGEDGCCDEGAQYFRHAGLCLFNCLELLNGITDHSFTAIYLNEKIKNIASYILNVHVDGIYYVNFADCSPVAGRCGAREYLFGKRTGNKALMAFAALDYQNSEDPLEVNEHNLFYRVQTIFTHAEMLTFRNVPAIQHSDFWYESVGIFIARDDHLFLAVKAGDNDDSHNHNDTGSFTIYKDGKPLLIDVGVETYTKKTFSPERYEIWTMQSRYHNLPSFWDGEVEIMQKDGAAYAAKNVSYEPGTSVSRITMDIADAYPDERIHSYERTAVLKKGKQIIIKDHYEGALSQPVLSLMFYEEPTIEGNHIYIGDLASLSVTGCCEIKKQTLPITDERLKTTWKHDIYRIQVTMEQKDLMLIIE